MASSIGWVYHDEDMASPTPFLTTLAESGPDILFRYRFADPHGYEYVSPSVLEVTGVSARTFLEVVDIARPIDPASCRRAPGASRRGAWGAG